jgi:hypothetical protein
VPRWSCQRWPTPASPWSRRNSQSPPSIVRPDGPSIVAGGPDGGAAAGADAGSRQAKTATAAQMGARSRRSTSREPTPTAFDAAVRAPAGFGAPGGIPAQGTAARDEGV